MIELSSKICVWYNVGSKVGCSCRNNREQKVAVKIEVNSGVKCTKLGGGEMTTMLV